MGPNRSRTSLARSEAMLSPSLSRITNRILSPMKRTFLPWRLLLPPLTGNTVYQCLRNVLSPMSRKVNKLLWLQIVFEADPELIRPWLILFEDQRPFSADLRPVPGRRSRMLVYAGVACSSRREYERGGS